MSALALWQLVLRYWKLAVIGLLIALLGVQTARIEGFKVWPINVRGLKQRVQDYRQVAIGYKVQLDGLADKSQRQIEQTGRTVERVVREGRDNPRAEKVERAPLPGSCKSPPEVLSADL